VFSRIVLPYNNGAPIDGFERYGSGNAASITAYTYITMQNPGGTHRTARTACTLAISRSVVVG
jgi:hypothetical protein